MDKVDLWEKAICLRKKLGEDASSPVDIFALAYAIDKLSLVYYPMGEHLSGMCIKDGKNTVIAVNSTMTLGRQRFSLAHELYHLFYDEEYMTVVCAKRIGAGTEKERKADQFASYFLMPPDALSGMLHDLKEKGEGQISVKDVVRIEQYFQVSRQAILYRLIDDKVLLPAQAEHMRQNVIRSAIDLGYNDMLYKPMPENKQYGTYGYYIQQAEMLMERQMISVGKYEELLLEAYRADLVYGEEGGDALD